jgi:hypothetical protein
MSRYSNLFFLFCKQILYYFQEKILGLLKEKEEHQYIEKIIL